MRSFTTYLLSKRGFKAGEYAIIGCVIAVAAAKILTILSI